MIKQILSNTTICVCRDDENDKSDDEDERVDFAANKAAIDRQKMRDNFLSTEHGRSSVVKSVLLQYRFCESKPIHCWNFSF